LQVFCGLILLFQKMTSIESSEQSIFIEACEIGLVKALIVLRSLLKQVQVTMHVTILSYKVNTFIW
jgi:hypothetical protein